MTTLATVDTTHSTTARSSATSPVVFVVDDDVSVRESLEMLIETAGWQVETFASAQDFLDRPRTVVPSCLVLDVSLPASMVSLCRSGSPSIGRSCPSSSSPATGTCRCRCRR